MSSERSSSRPLVKVVVDRVALIKLPKRIPSCPSETSDESCAPFRVRGGVGEIFKKYVIFYLIFHGMRRNGGVCCLDKRGWLSARRANVAVSLSEGGVAAEAQVRVAAGARQRRRLALAQQWFWVTSRRSREALRLEPSTASAREVRTRTSKGGNRTSPLDTRPVPRPIDLKKGGGLKEVSVRGHDITRLHENAAAVGEWQVSFAATHSRHGVRRLRVPVEVHTPDRFLGGES